MTPIAWHAGKWGGGAVEAERNTCFMVSWFNHCSTECLDKVPKSRTVVKFPLQPHRMLRNGQNGKKSNLKVKNTVLKPSYL